MGRNVTVIPKAPLGRILMDAGAKRVSSEALDAFVEVLTEVAMTIGEKSTRIAKHTGITPQDL